MDTHTHTPTPIHTHAHAHKHTYSTPLQGSHAENCFGHGDEEKGVWGVVKRKGGLFNLHF